MRVVCVLAISLFLASSASRADDGAIADVRLADLTIPAGTSAMTKKPNVQLALACFKTGEQISGLNKICFYDCAGSGAAITIKAAQVCPLIIHQ